MELSSRHPEEGGIYVWTRTAFGDFTGFIAAWMYWMSNLPFFAGVLYFGAASVLIPFGPRAQSLNDSPLYFMGFAAFWLAVIITLNIRGVDSGKWLNNICSIGSLVPLGVLMAIGRSLVDALRTGHPLHHGNPHAALVHRQCRLLVGRLFRLRWR